MEGIERQKSHLNLLKEVPDSVISVASLAELLKLIDECRICDGCGNIEQFAEVLLDGGNSIFKKRDGKDGVCLETQSVRSTDCAILVTKSFASCQACQKSNHYLRTLIKKK